MYTKSKSSSIQSSTTHNDLSISELKAQLNYLIIDNSSYRNQIKLFKEEIRSHDLIISKLKSTNEEENKAILKKFLENNLESLEKTNNLLDKSIQDSMNYYNKAYEEYNSKFGEDSELYQFENKLFMLHYAFEEKENEIFYLEDLYNNLASGNLEDTFVYFNIDSNTINEVLKIELNEFRGRFGDISNKYNKTKQKNEQCLDTIKVNILLKQKL